MRKILSIVLVTTISVGLFAGCGGSKESEKKKMCIRDRRNSFRGYRFAKRKRKQLTIESDAPSSSWGQDGFLLQKIARV